MRRSLAIWGLVATLLAPPAAEAAPRLRESMAVLPLLVGDHAGRASVSAIYDAVVRATRSRLGLRVISSEEIFVASREGLAQRVADCGTDDGCIAAKLRMFDARFGLVVVLSYDLDPPIYSLRLLDTDGGRKIAERVGEVAAGAEIWSTLEAEADALLAEARFVKSGRVVVEVEPGHAQLRLTSGIDPDPGTPNVFTLAPGRYTVEGFAEGHDAAKTEFEIASGASHSVRLELDAQTSIWQSPWLWVGVGLVVVGATATTIAVTQQPDPCLCTSLNGQGCICR